MHTPGRYRRVSPACNRDFKAYASRRLNMVNDRAIRWAAGGNAARLSSREAIEAAANYVADQQGEPMAVLVAR